MADASSSSTIPNDHHSVSLAGISPDKAGEAAKPKIKKEWYQNDTHVYVTFYTRSLIPDLTQADVKVDLQARSASLTISIPDKPEGVYDLDPLARSIDAEKSTFKIGKLKVELILAKAQPGLKWKELDGIDEEGTNTGTISGPSTSTNANAPTSHGYPSSARTKKNWDALAQEAEKQEKKESDDLNKDPNSGGDRELNKVFQSLYAGATPEQRRAMIKSYQLSGGTSLSTNWADVEKGIGTEIQPPDGMVAKKWDQ